LAAVFVFFAISGFLVTQSFEQTQGPMRYLVKRCLRIFPGYIVVLVLTAFALGPLVTTLPVAEYFRRPEPYWYVLDNAVFNINLHELPGVLFVDNAVGLEVNGSLWSLGYEFEMYLMVLALGVLRLIRLRVCVALLALGMACIHFDALSFLGGWGWMLGFFAAGMAIYKMRDLRIFHPNIALFAALGLILSGVYQGAFIQLFPIFGCYLALYLALHPRLPVIPAARFGDLSYGLYIYGWPSQQTVIWLMHGHAQWWQVFVLSSLLAGTLAFLSWHLIEKRALRLKPGRGTWQGPGLAILRMPWRLKSPTAANSPSNTSRLSR
jgi:peptidoglycan/LPS O-acetylase OafA/YrhL